MQETKRLSQSVLVFLRKKNEWAHTKQEVVAMALTRRKMFSPPLAGRTNRKNSLGIQAGPANAPLGNQRLFVEETHPLKRVDPR